MQQQLIVAGGSMGAADLIDARLGVAAVPGPRRTLGQLTSKEGTAI
jgi:hypothetical protein